MPEPDSDTLDAPPPDDAAAGRWWALVGVALVAGVLTGVVGGAFRWLLGHADRWREQLLRWAHLDSAWRWLVPVVLFFVTVGLARLIVRYFPAVSGSGVQRVEALLRDELPLPRAAFVPAKFVGGLLSLGSGMVLGREGPTVQMGAVLGSAVASKLRLGLHDVRTIATASAGAGLGVAFSAPLGGAMFVFEEVAHAFRTRLVVATLVAVSTALVVSQWFVGTRSMFVVGHLSSVRAAELPAYAILGGLLGVLGVGYNRLVVALLNVNERIRVIPAEVKAGLVGALIGAIGVINPNLVGGGDAITERILIGNVAVVSLLGLVVVRWFLGPTSYSVGTPGGLFAPLLVVGAAFGALYSHGVGAVSTSLGMGVTSAAIVGMSAFFAAVVRAPVTGVVLIMEMTATTTLAIPMALASACAVLAATLLRGAPIYDTLRLRLPDRHTTGA